MRKFSIILVAFMLMCSLYDASADTWNPTHLNSGAYDWADNANWTDGSYPTSSDGVVMNITSGYTINFPTSVSISFLTLNVKTNSDITFTSTGDVAITTSGVIGIGSTTGSTTYTGALVSAYTFTLTSGTTTTLTNSQIKLPLVNIGLIGYQGNTFFKTLSVTVPGTAGSSSNGGNTYKDVVSIVHTSTSTMSMAITAGDVFEKAVTFDNRTGAGNITFGFTAGNIFNDVITFKSSAVTAIGIGNGNANAVVTLQNNAAFSANATDFAAGTITLARINQTNTLSSTISCSTTGTTINIGNNSHFKGELYLLANVVSLNGKGSVATSTDQNQFDAFVSIQCNTGNSNGANTFGLASGCSLELVSLSSSTSNTIMNVLYDDYIAGDVKISNLGAGSIYLAKVGTTHLNGNLILGSTGTGSIFLGYYLLSTANVLQAEGKQIIQNSTLNLTAGNIFFYGFQQQGATSAYTTTSTLDMSGRIAIGSAANETDSNKVILRSPLNWKANLLTMNFGLYYSDVVFESKSGYNSATSNTSYPNTHFYGNLTLNNSGSNLFIVGNFPTNICLMTIWKDLVINQAGSGAIYFGKFCTTNVLGNTTITQNGSSGNIEIGYANSYATACATATVLLQGNIILNKIGTGSGAIRFGYNSLVKHNGAKNISVGSSGWGYGGVLYFTNFQQYLTAGNVKGTSVLNMSYPALGSIDDVTANWALVQLYATSIFQGPLTITAPGTSIYGGVYNSAVIINKTNGSNNTPVTTGSVFDFEGTLTINHTAPTGSFYLMSNAADAGTFKGAVVLNQTAGNSLIGFVRLGTGHLYDNLSNNSTGTYVPAIGPGGGILIFEGGNAQAINSTPTLTVPRFKLNKTANDVTLNSNLICSVYGDFTQGRLIVPKDVSGNPLYTVTFSNTAVSMNANILSFVDGTVTKTGTSGGAGFTFPIGSGSIFMPLTTSELCTTTSTVKGTYYNKPQTNGYTIGTGLKDISNCDYWYLTQSSGTCSFTVSMPWTSQTCHLVNKNVMAVALYSSSQWISVGSNALTGTNVAGSVTSNTSTQYGYITRGFTDVALLDTRNVYTSSFTIGTGADNHTATYTSGGLSGSSPGTTTLLSYQNNYPGVIVLHPDKSSSCVQVNIAANTLYTALNLCLTTDASGVINGATTSGNTVSSDYYTSSGNNFIIYPNKKSDGAISVVNNLLNGTIWKKTSNPTLTFTAGGNVFAYAHLKVTDVNGTVKYDNNLTTDFSYTGSALNWTGSSSITTDGLYVYQLSLGATAGTAIVYTGNMVVKVSE